MIKDQENIPQDNKDLWIFRGASLATLGMMYAASFGLSYISFVTLRNGIPPDPEGNLQAMQVFIEASGAGIFFSVGSAKFLQKWK